jgi:hypothetical protein
MVDIFQSTITNDNIHKLNPDIVHIGIGKPENKRNNDITQNHFQDHYIDENGNLDVSSITSLVESQKQTKVHNNQKDVKTEPIQQLEQQLQTLEYLEIADAITTTDSPWNTIVDQILKLEKVKQMIPDEHQRLDYCQKLLFPLGASLYKEIRSITSDPLTQETIFHCIAEDIVGQKKLPRVFEQYSENHQNIHESIEYPMKKIILLSFGNELHGSETPQQLDSLYMQCIHKEVLRGRLLSEQPMFIIKQIEQLLENKQKELQTTNMPFAKEELQQSIREIQNDLRDAQKIRASVDSKLPIIDTDQSLLHALDEIHDARFDGMSRDVVPPHTLEPWVPTSRREDARDKLQKLLLPHEDITAKTLKGIHWAEKHIAPSINTLPMKETWAHKKYNEHMKWLADDSLQAKRKQTILNIIDLTMTITSLASGVSGTMQRQIEGASTLNISSLINTINTQEPWLIAQDLATPKTKGISTFV